jgi:hypothetical protein
MAFVGFRCLRCRRCEGVLAAPRLASPVMKSSHTKLPSVKCFMRKTSTVTARLHVDAHPGRERAVRRVRRSCRGRWQWAAAGRTAACGTARIVPCQDAALHFNAVGLCVGWSGVLKTLPLHTFRGRVRPRELQ